MSVYIIAEAGVNHNGKLDLALKLCDAAEEAGVDAVKFQTWKTEKIVTKSAAKAAYQEENTKAIQTEIEGRRIAAEIKRVTMKSIASSVKRRNK